MDKIDLLNTPTAPIANSPEERIPANWRVEQSEDHYVFTNLVTGRVVEGQIDVLNGIIRG